jgi:hypothetical protein
MKYRILFDEHRWNTDKKAYLAEIQEAQNVARALNIDFNKNIMIICDIDVIKKMFIAGLFMLGEFRSLTYLNIYELLEISYGMRSDDIRIDDSTGRGMESTADITQDMLCLTANYDELLRSLCDDLAPQTVRRRYERSPAKGKPPKLTWVYSYSSAFTMKKNYPKLFNIYENGGSMFKMYDLNSMLAQYNHSRKDEDKLKLSGVPKVEPSASDYYSQAYQPSRTEGDSTSNNLVDSSLDFNMPRKGYERRQTTE